MTSEPKLTSYQPKDLSVNSCKEADLTAEERVCAPVFFRFVCALVIAGLSFFAGTTSVAQPPNGSLCQTCLARIDQAIKALGGEQKPTGEQHLLVKETIDGKTVIEKHIKTVGSVDILTSQLVISGGSDVPRGRKLIPGNQITRKQLRQESLWIYHPQRQLLAIRAALPNNAEILSMENPTTGKQEDALLIPASYGQPMRMDRQAWFFDPSSNLPKVVVIYRSSGDGPPVADVTLAFQRFGVLDGVVSPVLILQKMWDGHETMIEISVPGRGAQ